MRPILVLAVSAGIALLSSEKCTAQSAPPQIVGITGVMIVLPKQAGSKDAPDIATLETTGSTSHAPAQSTFILQSVDSDGRAAVKNSARNRR